MMVRCFLDGLDMGYVCACIHARSYVLRASVDCESHGTFSSFHVYPNAAVFQ